MALTLHYLQTGIVTTLSKIVVTLSAVLILWLSTDYLGKDDFGNFIYAYTLVAMLGVILSSPFRSIILYRISRGGESGDEIAAWNIAWSLVAGVAIGMVLWLCAAPLALFMDKPDLGHWLTWLALFLPLDIVRQVLGAWQQAQHKPGVMVYYQEFMPYVLNLVFLYGVWIMTYGNDMAFMAALMLAYAVPVIALFARQPVGWTNLRKGITVRAITRWDISYGLKSMGIQLINRPVRNIDILMLGIYMPSDMVAEYALATRLALLLMSGKESLIPLFIPRMGQLMEKGDARNLAAEYNQVRDFTVLTALPGIIFFAALGPVILPLFGAYHDSYPLLLILCAAMFVRLVSGSSGEYLWMLGYAGWTMIATIPSLIILVFGSVLLIPLMQAKGAAIVYFAAMVAVNALLALFIYRRNRFNVWPLSYVLLSLIICGALIMCAFKIIGIILCNLILLAAFCVFTFQRKDRIMNVYHYFKETLNRGRSA